MKPDDGATAEVPRKFEDSEGEWWQATFEQRPAYGRGGGSYVFQHNTGGTRYRLPADAATGPERLGRMALGDLRQLLAAARYEAQRIERPPASRRRSGEGKAAPE